ncbi:MAG: hypothetical protein ACRYFL_09010 [Janthinobacterium lividum]
MRKIILLTVFLFLSAVGVTAFYFSRLRLPGQNTANVINQIPADAALIFEFKNDPEFYDLFRNNTLLTSFIRQKKAAELKYLHQHLLKNVFDQQSIFISLHPKINAKSIDLLLTTNTEGNIDLQSVLKQNAVKFQVEKVGNQELIKVDFSAIKEAFYISSKANMLAGSFDKQLLIRFLENKRDQQKEIFKQLPDQQKRNSIANLYVSYKQLPVLIKQLFSNQNNEFFKLLNGFSANASLSLNYKSDALLFNGYTQTDTSVAAYINLFLKQQPAKITLKNIYPQNTASAVSFTFSDQNQFFKELDKWQNPEFHPVKTVFKQIKLETGISIQTVFRKQLKNEFAVITTAENENLAVIQLKNGSEFKSYLQNLSLNPNAAQLQLKYSNLFFYLLGEPLRNFKQPYFMVLDNFLFLAETESGLHHYLNRYHQQQFLNQESQYLNFDALQADQSNVSFFVDFKNGSELLKHMLRPEFKTAFEQQNLDWNTYYAMAMQFTASDNSFYTNFYLQQLKRDSIDTRKPNL